MPPPANRDEFFDLVRRSGVLDAERLDTFARATTESGTALEQPQAVAAQMIRNGLLTTFQAKQILQGKWRRFLINGKYKLMELIGAGGMGAVYLCEHIFMRRLVALKVLPVDKLDDPSALERFYREARAAGALDHVNIVRAFDIDHDDKLHFLVMEYVDGSSLQEIVAHHGQMEPVRAAQYIWQAANGLQHAHEAGLVHRDIKPGNLLLDRSGTIKILDLGLARFFNAHKDNVTEQYDDKAILGTADYLAPEQALGSAVDIRADIYGLGATFYFMLTGKAPFEDGSITQKLLWHQTRLPKSIRELRPEVPATMTAVIDKMMAKSPADRFATPNEVAAALIPWATTKLPPPISAEMPRRSPASLAPGSQGSPSVRSLPSSKVDTNPSMNGGIASPSTQTLRPATRPILAGIEPENAAVLNGSTAPVVPPRQSLAPNKYWIAAIGGSFAVAIIAVSIWWARLGSGEKLPASLWPQHRSADLRTSIAPESVIPAEQAVQHLHQRCTVELQVRRAGRDAKTDRYFLNSKDDYQAQDNFTVTFTKRVAEQLQAKGVGDIVPYFQRKTVRVTGAITDFRGRPQIEIDDLSQLQVMGHNP